LRSARPKKPDRSADAGPNPIDVHVGLRIRLRRNMLARTQTQPGRVLDVPITFFVDDLDPVRAPPLLSGFAEASRGEHSPRTSL
jgi:hypothetical protein